MSILTKKYRPIGQKGLASNWCNISNIFFSPLSMHSHLLFLSNIFQTWLGVHKVQITEKTIFSFPFTVNGIWSWWQFLNQMEFPVGSKTVTAIISHCPIISTVLGLGLMTFWMFLFTIFQGAKFHFYITLAISEINYLLPQNK